MWLLLTAFAFAETPVRPSESTSPEHCGRAWDSFDDCMAEDTSSRETWTSMEKTEYCQNRSSIFSYCTARSPEVDREPDEPEEPEEPEAAPASESSGSGGVVGAATTAGTNIAAALVLSTPSETRVCNGFDAEDADLERGSWFGPVGITSVPFVLLAGTFAVMEVTASTWHEPPRVIHPDPWRHPKWSWEVGGGVQTAEIRPIHQQVEIDPKLVEFGYIEDVDVYVDYSGRMSGNVSEMRVRGGPVRFEARLGSLLGDPLGSIGSIVQDDGQPVVSATTSEAAAVDRQSLITAGGGIGVQPFQGLISPYATLGVTATWGPRDYTVFHPDGDCHQIIGKILILPHNEARASVRLGNTFYFLHTEGVWDPEAGPARFSKGLDASITIPIASQLGPTITVSFVSAIGQGR